jgi:hypothetical protein
MVPGRLRTRRMVVDDRGSGLCPGRPGRMVGQGLWCGGLSPAESGEGGGRGVGLTVDNR